MTRRVNHPGLWHRRRGRLGVALLALCLGAVAASVPGRAAGPGEPREPEGPGEARFPHLYHAEELGFECEECHHEAAAAPLGVPHPEYFEDLWISCEACHRPGESISEPQSCGNCHVAAGGVGDETLSAKVVIHRSCWECHEVGTGAEASRACGFCHEAGDEE